MPSHTPAPVVPKPDSMAQLTGQLVVVTATSSGSPTTLVPLSLLAPGKTFVHVAGILIPGQTAAVELTLGIGGIGLGFEVPITIFPKRGFQLVLDWKEISADIGGPITAWASVGSVICCDVATVDRSAF